MPYGFASIGRRDPGLVSTEGAGQTPQLLQCHPQCGKETTVLVWLVLEEQASGGSEESRPGPIVCLFVLTNEIQASEVCDLKSHHEGLLKILCQGIR